MKIIGSSANCKYNCCKSIGDVHGHGIRMLPTFCDSRFNFKVNGVSKVEIEPKGSTGKVTVSFDDLKTDVKLIQSSVTKYGFDVMGG
ncbi:MULTISPECIES: heavy-metal-associated domain-containing protein [Paenibacillus]|uniref:Uncharacterized protein n=1 Tax=Paenibacillus albicereus TaxID=2726185 RepID=A0A6H2GWE2_9BACL|nr:MULTISPECIES: heavy-metal-associated domain-containing protein [Paenibacillus]QGG55885.1 hypothetical protein GE073_10060 [Paenibacillus sp. B01]QJC51679.1 hypothetical protein HGI30_09050 [Paenibacillus albicereus]CDN41317.1 hypothetical protein BN871_AE_00620 [Paenibacillus sp. P22]